MKALISPNEKVFNPNTGEEIGERVAEVAQVDFPVAPPLFWIDCADDVNTVEFYFDPTTSSILRIPEYIPAEQPQPEVSGAQTL